MLLSEKGEAEPGAPPSKQSPTATNSNPVDPPPRTTPRNDYDELAKGRWVPVLPSVEEFNRLRTQNAYRGAEPRLVGGDLECNGSSKLFFPSIRAKDIIVRALMKRSGPKHAGNAHFEIRNDNNGFVGAGFNGGGYFYIGKRVNQPWKDFEHCEFSEQYDDFFEFAFAVVGNRLIAYVNGRKILDVRDDAPLDRPAVLGVGTFGNCSGQFRKIEVQVLDKIPAEAKGPSEHEGFEAAKLRIEKLQRENDQLKAGQPTAKKAEAKKKASLSDRITNGTVLTGTYLFPNPGGESGTATLSITEREGNKVKGRYGAKKAGAAVAYPGFAFEGKIVGNRLTVKSVGNAAERTLTVSLKGDSLEGTVVLLDTRAIARVAFTFDK